MKKMKIKTGYNKYMAQGRRESVVLLLGGMKIDGISMKCQCHKKHFLGVRVEEERVLTARLGPSCRQNGSFHQLKPGKIRARLGRLD